MPEFETIAEGLAFPEGPVVLADGSVIVVEVFAGRITRCWNGGKETICEIGGGPNGAAIGPDGALYVCNNGGIGPDHFAPPDSIGRIERVDLGTGRFERIYESCEDQPLSAPNDLVFDCDGQVWFTDMGRIESDGKKFGGLYCAAPGGTSITRIVEKALSYNGIGLSPDMRRVYVADTMSARIYAVERRAAVQQAVMIGAVPGQTSLDSLAMTAAGNICVAAISERGAIATVTPGGAMAGMVDTADQVTTNIAFGGADLRDAFITLSLHGMVVKTRWDEPGLRLAYNG